MREGSGSGSGDGKGRRLRSNPPGVRDGAGAAETPPKSTSGRVATEQRDGERPEETAFDRSVHLLVVATGVAAWAVAGLVVLLALTVEPRDGLAGGGALFKAADVVGWLAIGALVLRDALARRRRTLALGLAAWAWVVVLSWLIGQTGQLAGMVPA